MEYKGIDGELGLVCIVWGIYIWGKVWIYYKGEQKNERNKKGD